MLTFLGWLDRAVAGTLEGGDARRPLATEVRLAVAERREQEGCHVEAAWIRAVTHDRTVRVVRRADEAACPNDPEEREILAAGGADGAQRLAHVLAVRLTDAARTDGRTERALRAVALAPGDVVVLRAAAGALWRDGQVDGAYGLYAEADRIAPEDSVTVEALARLAWQRGDAAETQRRVRALPPGSETARAIVAAMDRAARREQASAARHDEDPQRAAASLARLVAEDPSDAQLVRTQAEFLLDQGDVEGALEGLARAQAIEPSDPWSWLIEAQTRLARGETAEARAVLRALPETLDAEARRARDATMAAALRAAGDAERAAGRLGSALLRYSESLQLVKDPWTRVGLAGVYMERGAWSEALESYEDLSASEDPSVAEVAARGRAGALEALQRREEALAVLDALATERPSAANVEARDALAVRVTVARWDVERKAGRAAEADAALSQLAIDSAESPDVHAALAAVRLDRGDARGAVDAAIWTLGRQPTHPWALQTAALAAGPCGCAREVLPWIAGGAAAGSTVASGVMARVRATAAVEEARLQVRGHRADEARLRLREVAERDDMDAAAWLVLAGGWEAIGRGREARQAWERAGSLAPGDRGIARGHVDLLRRQGRVREARRVAVEAHVPLVPRTSDGKRGGAPSTALPAQAGRRTLDTRRWTAASSAGVLSRVGVPGVQAMRAWFTPVTVGRVTPTGPSWTVEAVPTWLSDGVHDDDGVSASVAWATPMGRWGRFAARSGTSPLGFAAGAYPTWNLAVDATPGAGWFLRAETGRVPLHESLPAWAGAVDPASGERYGGVSHAWLGVATGWGGAHADLGALGRAGYVSGLGMEPVQRIEAVAWAGGHVGSEHGGVRGGLEGVGMLHDRQADAFAEGSGAFYSPPRFASGSARVDGHWRPGALGVCGSVSGGAIVADGDDSMWFASGVRPMGRGALGVRFDLTARVRFEASASRLQVGPDWHQETGMFRLVLGARPASVGADAALSTFGPPGAGIVVTEEAC